MRVLGEELSKKASVMAEKIIKESKRKIVFKEINEPKCYVNTFDTDKYTVCINHEYSRGYFDFCVLHELHHTLQIDKEYPGILYESEASSSQEIKTMELIDSLVKDIYVNRYLLEQGFRILKSPISRFRNKYYELLMKSEKDSNDEAIMVICLVSLKYVYMQDIQDLLNNITDNKIIGIYKRISDVIEANKEESHISFEHIYRQFAEEFDYLKISDIRYMI